MPTLVPDLPGGAGRRSKPPLAEVDGKVKPIPDEARVEGLPEPLEVTAGADEETKLLETIRRRCQGDSIL